jgi:hypothetical protein
MIYDSTPRAAGKQNGCGAEGRSNFLVDHSLGFAATYTATTRKREHSKNNHTLTFEMKLR